MGGFASTAERLGISLSPTQLAERVRQLSIAKSKLAHHRLWFCAHFRNRQCLSSTIFERFPGQLRTTTTPQPQNTTHHNENSKPMPQQPHNYHNRSFHKISSLVIGQHGTKIICFIKHFGIGSDAMFDQTHSSRVWDFLWMKTHQIIFAVNFRMICHVKDVPRPSKKINFAVSLRLLFC